jgi:integrase/recombinase XerD
MLSLEIKSSHYNYLLKSYQEYLQILGYAAQTAKRWPIHVREFLYYLEQQNVQHITSVESKHVNDFIIYVKQRKNNNCKGTALSSSHINQIINAINAFAKYLNSTGKYILDSTPKRANNEITEKIILSIVEAKQLYEATFLPYRENSIAIGQRDRAIIAVYYG